MSTSYRNVTMVLGIVLLTAALLACGPLALLDRSNESEATEAPIAEQPSPTLPPEPTSTPLLTATPLPPAPTAIPTEPVEDTVVPGGAGGFLDDVLVSDLLFFESGGALPDYGDRVYDTIFPRSTTRYIAWELNLDYPEPGEQVDFEVYAIWYGPDGQIMTEQVMDEAFLGADWTSSAHAMGFGWDEPGEWDAGEYVVELYVEDQQMAAADFEIVADELVDTIDTAEAVPPGRIAFGSDRDGNPEIYVVDAAGGDVIRLTDSPEEDDDPSWSPDGEKIGFYSYRDGNGELYAVNADGSGLERLTNADSDEWCPVWSPDGVWIAFSSDRDGERQLFVMPADSRESDGSDWVRVTAPPGAAWKFDWSPDGETIVFDSDRDGARQLYTLPAPDAGGQLGETASSLLVADDNGIFDAAWSHDGDWIAFTATKPMANGRIDMVAADGTGRVTLTEDRTGDAAPTWSPDGDWIAFTSYRDGEGEIYVMPAPGSASDGMQPFNLTNTADSSEGWPAWSPK